MKQSSFTIKFTGSSLNDGLMDVRDLAPALLATGQLFDAANKVINGNKTKVKLHAKALTKGSFGIELLLDQNLIEQAKDLLSGNSVTAVLNLLEIIGIVGTSSYTLIKFIRWIKGKKPEKIEQIEPETMRITIDGTSVDIPISVFNLARDIDVREALSGMIAPLEQEGIESLEIIEKTTIIERIEKTERVYFHAPERNKSEEQKIIETSQTTAYTITSLAFKEDNKWRLNDGISTINVLIKDEHFLKQVNNNEISFAKNDILICEVKTIQWQTEDGLKTEYEVIKIKEHKHALKQLSLF